MNILNLIWGFSTGGIGKCFLTYDRLGEAEPSLKVISVCVIHGTQEYDLQPLYDQHVKIIHIKSNFDTSWMKPLKEIVDANHIDYYFAHSHNGPIMLRLFNSRYRLHIPIICTCHGLNPKPTIMSHLFVKMLLSIWKSSWVKKVICVENFTHKMLEDRGVKPEKIVTVYNGVEASIDTQQLDLSGYCDSKTPVIITASRLTKIKGVDYLLTALNKVKEKGISFHYFCIGNGEEEATLRNQCAELGLNKEVSFMGYQNNIPDWLASCEIFALPSLEEFHSIAILEAMRAQKAIVATNIGGNPESLRDGLDALMVPSKDPDALCEALTRLLTSQKLREKLSASANQRFKELFTIDAMMNNLAREIITTQ